MPTSYPGALDATVRPTAGQALGGSTPTHSVHHDNAYDAIEALEGKLGIGASVAAANTVLRGTGAGASAFGLVQTGDIQANAVSQVWTAAITTVWPTTTQPAGSGTVLMPDMTVSVTTTGGPLMVLFECMSSNSAAGNENVYDLYLDGAHVTRRQFHQAVAGYNTYCALVVTTTPSAASHTVEVRWAVTAGTLTSIGDYRSMTVIEFRR